MMMVSTCGTSPATADIMKLVEPWQWMIALISGRPVSFTTASHRGGMVVGRGLIERPGLGGSRCSPASSPARRRIRADTSASTMLRPDRRPEDVGAHARAVHQQHRPAVAPRRIAHVDQVRARSRPSP